MIYVCQNVTFKAVEQRKTLFCYLLKTLIGSLDQKLLGVLHQVFSFEEYEDLFLVT